MPLLSLAMATRNAARFLPAALASVPEPPIGWDFEILVADGASTDATLDIAAADRRVRIVSRADAGIYDGMNRAIAGMRGNWLLILNADDLLIGPALREALMRLAADRGYAHATGGALFGTKLTEAVIRRPDAPLDTEGALFGIPAINARLIHADLAREIGPIRTDLGLGADREWLLRVAGVSAPSLRLDTPFYFYRSHATSHTLAGDRAGRRRVYRAEAQLAAGCLADLVLPAETQCVVRAAYALARFKSRLTGGADQPAQLPAGQAASLRDLFRGLHLAWRWRGRLSGF